MGMKECMAAYQVMKGAMSDMEKHMSEYEKETSMTAQDQGPMSTDNGGNSGDGMRPMDDKKSMVAKMMAKKYGANGKG